MGGGGGGGTHINGDTEVFAEDFDLKLEVELKVGFLVKLSQHIHDGHGPGVGGLEDTALHARLDHLGDEGHHVEELCLALVVGF